MVDWTYIRLKASNKNLKIPGKKYSRKSGKSILSQNFGYSVCFRQMFPPKNWSKIFRSLDSGKKMLRNSLLIVI